MAPPALPDSARERLAAIVGEGHVRDDAAARAGRCRGKSYLDLLRQRAGDCEDAPDAVVAPGDAREAQQVIYACSEEGVAVVPYGGGTSVVGGLEPLRGRFGALVSLDLGRLEGLLSFDERSRTAWLGGGTRLPEADQALGQRGYTLGHTPQSYEWATVGGCVATRSAGQSSTGHGRIEDNVVALRCATPAGELATLAVPATAAGPSLKQLVIGSEGTLGVITERGAAGLPAARRRALRGLVRALLRRGRRRAAAARPGGHRARRRPALRRGGDADVARARRHGRADRAGGAGAAARARLRRRLPADLRLGGRRRTRSRAAARRRRGRCGGRVRCRSAVAPGAPGSPAATPARTCATTCSTAACSSRRSRPRRAGRTSRALRSAVTRALEGALAAPLVVCHLSHLYATGASLYFTALAAQDREDPFGQWRAAKRAATDAIVAAGGTITHHHAVGADHAPWLPAEVGSLGHDVLRMVKERCDPAGVMNPGKLLRSSRSRAAACRAPASARAACGPCRSGRDQDLAVDGEVAREGRVLLPRALDLQHAVLADLRDVADPPRPAAGARQPERVLLARSASGACSSPGARRAAASAARRPRARPSPSVRRRCP